MSDGTRLKFGSTGLLGTVPIATHIAIIEITSGCMTGSKDSTIGRTTASTGRTIAVTPGSTVNTGTDTTVWTTTNPING